MSHQRVSSSRISGADPETLTERERRVFDQQERKWGEPLGNHLIYARCPEIFHGAQAMWRGLRTSGKLDSALASLVNRRVALLNDCVF